MQKEMYAPATNINQSACSLIRIRREQSPANSWSAYIYGIFPPQSPQYHENSKFWLGGTK